MIVEYDFLELLKALRACVSKPQYRVGVFTPSVADAKTACAETYNEIKEDIELASATNGCIDRSCDQFITFCNGSYVKFISASIWNTRGRRFHHILYVKDIKPDVIACLDRLQQQYMEENNGTSG